MIRTIVIAAAFLGLALLPNVTAAQTASAAKFDAGATYKDESGTQRKCSSSFLGFPAWFRGLERKNGTCQIDMTASKDGKNIQSMLFIIVLNIIEIALRLIGFAAVGFVIYGGFKYLTSAGSADRVTSGRKIIQNALIGLVISFFSVAIVNLIASNIN